MNNTPYVGEAAVMRFVALEEFQHYVCGIKLLSKKI